VDVTSFRVDGFLQVLQNKPDMVFSLLMVFCARVVDCQEQVARLAFDEVRVRLVKEMLRLSGMPAGQLKSGQVELPVH